MAPRSPDVSVIVPFGDHEDTVGIACRRLAEHLGSLGLAFELLAIEEDSGDNSHALLGLLRKQIPELEVLRAEGRDRGYASAARRARGRVLWLISPEAALRHLAPFARARRRVDRGEIDAVVVGNRFAVCHRTRCLDALRSWRGHRFPTLRRKLGAGRVEAIRLGAAGAAPAADRRPGLMRLLGQVLLAR